MSGESMNKISRAEIENKIGEVRHELRSGLACVQGAFESLCAIATPKPEHLQLQASGSQKIEAAIARLAKLSEQLEESAHDEL